MPDDSHALRAQSKFIERQKKADDRASAKAEYELEAKMRNAKIAKLRALRLAKEEADKAAIAEKPKGSKPSRAARTATPIKRGVGSW
ncbi:MAG: hypothetical protein MUC58_02260 [Rhizobiaceae bacterium]|nr:hypothetical protein [Rhizobiaceae bacterium]